MAKFCISVSDPSRLFVSLQILNTSIKCLDTSGYNLILYMYVVGKYKKFLFYFGLMENQTST